MSVKPSKSKSKAVLVTTEVPVQTGGIGTFVWNFAKLLKAEGHDVLVILANPTPFPRRIWAQPFDELGIDTTYVFGDQFQAPDGYNWYKRVSETVAGMIPDDADVVYLADWQAKGFDFVRKRRFSAQPGPAIVTVLHGSTRWLREGMRTAPQSEDELYLDYAEAYCARFGDYVVSPGNYMLSWARSAGWKVPAGDFSRVINYPFFPKYVSQGAQSVTPVSAAAIVVAQQTTTTTHAESAHITTVDTPERSEVIVQVATATVEQRATTTAIALATSQHPTASTASAAPLAQARSPFRRIVFFGRIETRKGIELFVDGIAKLKDRPCMDTIEEIVLLGGPSLNPFGTPDDAAAELARRLDGVHLTSATEGTKTSTKTSTKSSTKTVETTTKNKVGTTTSPTPLTVQAITNLNTFQAQQYLAEHASDTLVIMPSIRENFPLSVIETSLIPGLNILASTAGSIGEILGPQGHDHLFEPFLTPFSRKLEETLLAGPRPDDELGHYDWQSANAAWTAFHEEAVAFARERIARDSATQTLAATDRSVDVCVSYYNLGEYLPYLLQSLERQTVKDFNVIVINDGSPDPKSIQVFEEQAARYAARGWKFITTPNGGLSAARNAGAAAGDGHYLIFIDADDVVAPTLVERFRSALEISGDDCLSCFMHLFRGEGWNDAYTHSAFYCYTPSGPDPILGLVSNPFGGACMIVKREAFNAIEGFTTDVSRYVGFEDYEFYLRLMLEGYKLDVVPEYLLYYRVRDEGMFRTNDLHENRARILRTYERKLQQLGFPGLASLAAGLYRQQDAQNSQLIPRSAVDVSYLVYQVSGHTLWKALRLKLRNQVAKRLGRPLRGA